MSGPSLFERQVLRPELTSVKPVMTSLPFIAPSGHAFPSSSSFTDLPG